MKKNKPIQWPTKVVIVLLSIIMSFIVFFIVIGVITLNLGKEIEKEQQDIFDGTTVKIREIIETNKDYSYLRPFVVNGYRVIITNSNGKIIYPQNDSEPFNYDFNMLLVPMRGIVTQFKVNDLNVYISYPIQLTPPDISNIILESVPYVLFLAAFSIAVIITIYVSLFKRERKKLDILFDLTKMNVSNDEIVDLNLNLRLEEYAEIESQVKELYSELKYAQNKLEKEVQLVKKLESNNSALLKGMTHEMKTPLMSTKLLVNQLENLNQAQNTRDILIEINNQTNNLDQLIREILFISQKNNLSQQSEQSSIEIINEVIHHYDVLLEDKKLTVCREFINDFFMELDRKIIEKVFSNLISNAINYTLEDSIIFIKVTENSLAIKNKISGHNNIDLQLIGEPFATFSSISGTGLGIYLVETMLANSPYTLTIEIQEEGLFVTKISIAEPPLN
ncbi:signal transduction histidine kinase [Enterococcus rotai]|uniref:histidine kinase n=1 Tax=Enterococcus rotai TaxID=118060 RepID=A0A0U2MVT4_9ENTE|nr:HAMP domain-containing sensor histidine kinase [Enterococcus rotai]ALS36547.1 hypothetical protein ATZ35_05045 [Enterococcus rotai]